MTAIFRARRGAGPDLYAPSAWMAAVERFDPDRQVKFETYAVLAHQGLDHRRARARSTGCPRSCAPARAEIERKAEELEHRLQRAPTKRSWPRRSGWRSTTSGRDTQISNSPIVALDETWSVSSGGESLTLIDTIGDSRLTNPSDLLDVTELRDTLADAIARLPERRRSSSALLLRRLTARQIGDVLAVTESRVSSLHTKRSSAEGTSARDARLTRLVER